MVRVTTGTIDRGWPSCRFCRTKKRTKQVMPNAMVHLLLTDGQPDHKQRPHLPGQLPPYLLLSTMPYGLAYSFGQSGSPVRALSPPSSCCTPSLLAGRAAREAEKPLALGMRCSATTKPSGWDRHSSHPKSKTQLHTSHREENYLYPSQNQDKMPLLYEGWRMAQQGSNNQKGRQACTQSPNCQIGEESLFTRWWWWWFQRFIAS